MNRRDAVARAIQHAQSSRRAVDSCQKEWALAHNAYNAAVTEQPYKGRRSGTDLEDLRMHSIGAYEALLDSMRIHHDNLAHLAAIKGKL